MKNSAAFEIIGNNYKIRSDPMIVSNMNVEIERFCAFVAERGGSHRKHENWSFRTSEGFLDSGYFNRVGFSDEFFLDGIIVGLSGTTNKEYRFYVNPARSDLRGDMHSRNGVGLCEIGEYLEYERARARGAIENRPTLGDCGTMVFTLEGAVKYLVKSAPKFYDVTGLPREWPTLPPRLIAKN